MPFYNYSYTIKKEENNDDNDNYCYRCKNMFDNDELSHFNHCRKYYVCIDCRPNFCNGDDFEEVIR